MQTQRARQAVSLEMCSNVYTYCDAHACTVMLMLVLSGFLLETALGEDTQRVH